jgi:di/tricarboxylate transporter
LPDLPSPHAITAIVLALAAVYLYTRDRIPLETSSFLILAVILVWVERFPVAEQGEQIRAGDILADFGNEALLSVVCLVILARGLEATRALQPIGRFLAGLWTVRPQLAFLVTLVTIATLSMFLNNTPLVAAMLPLLTAVSLQAKVPASGILMPAGFATSIGGTATTIGTSTNLLAVAVAADLGMREFRMFEFAPPIFIVGGVAILFLWLIAPRMLPQRTPVLTNVAPRLFESRLRVNDSGPADGTTVAEALALTRGRMRINRIEREGLLLMKLPSARLRDGDLLHVRDTAKNLKEFERVLGATLLAGETDHAVSPENPLRSDQRLAEIVVTESSALDLGSINSDAQFAAHGIVPLALHRPGREAGELDDLSDDTELRAGDILLVQGPTAGIEALKRRGRLLVLDGNIDLPRPARASLALAIVGAVVVFAGIGLMRIALAAFLGVALMLATRCLTWKDLVGAIDRRIVLVIVSSLALGTMLMATGAAEYIAEVYVSLTAGWPVPVVLSGLLLIMALLSEVMSNNAIAVLGTPIAISIAAQLGVPPEPFVLAVIYGANMSFMIPAGYQVNLMIMTAGGYRVSDFVRVGLVLQMIMWIGLSLILPLFYDL